MKKQFAYIGFNFTIKVQLDFLIERRLNGSREHKLEIVESNGIYLRELLCTTENLENSIEILQNTAKEYIHNMLSTPKSEAENILLNLGFSS